MCVLSVIYFIILLLNILLFLDDKQVVWNSPLTTIKNYFLFNKDLVYLRYTNIHKFYNSYGFNIMIQVILLKGAIMILLTYT